MDLWIFISIDVIAMGVITMKLGKKFGFQLWKRIVLPVLFGITGVAGVKLLNFIEKGQWSGMSYFGAVFFSPIILIAVAPLMKIKIGDMLDIAAPCECITLAIQKLDCLYNGCCRGMIMKITSDGKTIRFPSQIVESINGMILTVILIYLIVKGKHKYKVYFIYMVAYGLTRYGLNWLRETEPAVWFLPFGTIWSILCSMIGAFVLLFLKNKKKRNNE